MDGQSDRIQTEGSMGLKGKCICKKKSNDEFDNRIIKMGGVVVVGLVFAKLVPGDGVGKGRIIGVVVVAAVITLIMMIFAFVSRLRTGHSLICALWGSIRATII